MKRVDLEHLIRACADIADDDEIVVIGSQAVLGSFPFPPATGLCLEVHDLCLSKYVANREKDRRYVRAAAAHGLVNRGTLLERLPRMPIEGPLREHIRSLIELDFATAPGRGH